MGIAIDKNNNVYVTDTSNNRIEEFDSNGSFIGQFGQFSGVAGDFFSPQGLGISSSGQLIIADGLLQRIVFYNVTP